MTTWKSKVISYEVPFKVISATVGAISYCWQMSVTGWLFWADKRMTPFNLEVFAQFPWVGLAVGGWMGYISAQVLVLWCQQYYRTAHFIAFSASVWCVALGIIVISLIFVGSNRPFFENTKLILQFGMPFFWGLILQVCALRLNHLLWRIET